MSAQCVIGTEKNHDSAFLLIYDGDDYSQEYGQIKEAFRALTKRDILQPYITDRDCTSSNDGDDIGYNFYVFDKRCQKNLESAQPINLEIKILENVPAGTYGYALVLTKKLVSKSSDVQRHFNLI